MNSAFFVGGGINVVIVFYMPFIIIVGKILYYQ